MSIFNFLRDPVLEVISNVAKQSNVVQDTQNQVKGYVNMVTGSWIGGDEQAFSQEVTGELVPEIADFIAALAGLNTNTQKAMDIMDKADSAAKGIANQAKDLFSSI
jgi:WXG100 family type VII secretion target